MADIAALAQRLDRAARQAQAIEPLGAHATLSLEDAYAVQRALVGLRLARGERRCGIRMELTNRAKPAQMGVSDMVWGRLTDGMSIEDGGAVRRGAYLHPRVEPQVAFLMKRELDGRVTPHEARAAVEAVAPAMALIDSRYRDSRLSHVDVVADNASCAGFVAGAWRRPDLDLSNLGLALCLDGRALQIGSSAAILGDPARSLAAAARFAAQAGEPLQPGWIVLAGGATAAEAVPAGVWVQTEIQHLGRVSFRVEA